MRKEIQKQILGAIEKIWPSFKINLEKIEVTYPPGGLGDYSCSIALKLSKEVGEKPMEVAAKLVKLLDSFIAENKNIKKIEIAGPGFLNFYLNEKHWQSLVEQILKNGGKYGNLKPDKKEKINLEFVSANPTGPIHLGNGRGAPYGDTLANILTKAGHEIWREYYVNDFGNQVKILGHSVLKDEEAQYKGEYIDKLHKENKLSDPFETGQWAAEKILEEIIKPSMEKMGIKFDKYFSEKTLYKEDKITESFKILEEEGLLYEKDGALWFKATQFNDEKDRVVKKSTGEITYFGNDIANHKNKFERGFGRAINIWGADHHGDVKRVLGAVEALGYKNRLEIILTQMVRVIKDGQELKMSKRAGTYISMDDLIEEVGKDAVRFFFLMYSNNSHINFDVNLAKEKSDKNPVFYVQYAHARICSILRKAKIQNSKSETISKSEIQNSKVGLLINGKELSLLKHLGKFPELIEDMTTQRETHLLPEYLIKLADKLHSFYDECRVIDENNPELTLARIELIKTVKTVLAEGLRLMGVSAPEKM